MSDILTRAPTRWLDSPVGGKARALAARRAPACRAALVRPVARRLRGQPPRRSNGRGSTRARRDAEIVAIIGSAQPSAPVRASLDRASRLSRGDRRTRRRPVVGQRRGRRRALVRRSARELSERDRPRVCPSARRRGLAIRLQRRILAYRREHGLRCRRRAAGGAGAAHGPGRRRRRRFGADPVSGRRGVAVVSAVPGLGTPGRPAKATPTPGRSIATADRRARIVPSRMHAPTRTRRGACARCSRRGKLRARAGDAGAPWRARAAAPALRRAAGHRVGVDGDALVAAAVAADHLAGQLPDPDAQLAIWDNSNIVESYSGVTTPLTFSFARRSTRTSIASSAAMMGVPERVIAAHDDVFRQHARPGSRPPLLQPAELVSRARAAARLHLNRRFMEQMMGVREAAARRAWPRDRRPEATGARLVDGVYLGRTLAGLVAHHFTLDRRVRRVLPRGWTTRWPRRAAASRRRPDELAAHYRELRRQLLLRWDAPLVNDFFAMIFYGVLRNVTPAGAATRGHAAERSDRREGGIVSAEPAVACSGWRAGPRRSGAAGAADRRDGLGGRRRGSAAHPEFAARVPRLSRKVRRPRRSTS